MKERRDKIRNCIISKGFVHLDELAFLCPEVSSMTLRRDLEFLEQEGDIVRTKGGAKSILHLSMRKEESYNLREFINSGLKSEIAQKVNSLIEDNSCVFFDSGSTVMQIAKALSDKPMFAITSGPNIAMELTKNPNCEISMICGKLNRDNISLSGLNAIEFIKGINIGTAIMAASGYTARSGFTCGSYDECSLKREIIRLAARVIIVMDSTKLGSSHPFTFAAPEDIDCFVSDSKFDKKTLSDFKNFGITIY